MTFNARGAYGELRKGYQIVARLSAWHLDHVERLEATASDVNDFWIDDDGLELRLQVGNKAWVWRTFDILDRGTPFVIRVIGSPETR